MAGSVNKVILIGNLGREPEVKNTTSGQKVVTFSVATSDIWKDKSGQRQERTEWHRVVIFSPVLADVAAKYLHKGSKVYIEGSLQTRKWTDNTSGQERQTTEVVLSSFKSELALLDSKGSSSDGNSAGDWGSSSSATSSSNDSWDIPDTSANSSSDFNDEIPF